MVKRCALFSWLILSISTIAFGQTVNGTISGTVKDSSEAVIPMAQIVILNDDTGFSRTVASDSGGHYVAGSLPLGTYRVTTTSQGFQTAVRTGIVLTVAEQAVVDVVLSLGATTQTVQVAAEAPAIETSDATMSSLVSSEQIRDLPLNGRSIDSLFLLTPGAFASRGGAVNVYNGFGLKITANGSRPDGNLYLLDGTVINDANGGGSGSAAGVILGVEAILEFRVLTHNFSAEYGRNSGAIVSSVTRSGTNDFHGSAYEFLRNNVFDARNFFNPGALPPYRRNQFGGAAGGRIIKNRLFFFANYEGLRVRQGVTSISVVPDVNARKGLVPGTNGVLTQLPLNPASIPYLNLYPVPNGPNFGDGTAEYITNYSQPTTENYSVERIDYRISDKDSLYGRYLYDPSSTVAPRPTPIYSLAFTAVSNFFVLSETHIFSATSYNEFRASYNRTPRAQTSYALVSVDPSLGFVPGIGMGTIKFANSVAGAGNSGLSEIGPHSGSPAQFLQNIFEEGDTYSTIRGSHSLKFGVDVQRVQENYLSLANGESGLYNFGGLQDLIEGKPTSFQDSNFPGAPGLGANILGNRQILFGYFVQDEYRIRPNLTLNIGLRHEFYTTPTEINGRSVGLRNWTDPAFTPGPPFISPKLNFSPRIGIAWDPTGSGKTSVRLGAGVFYNQLSGRQYLTADVNSVYSPAISISNPAWPNQFAIGNYSNGIPAGAQATNAMEYHPQTPTVYEYHFEVQRQLVRDLTLRVAYVASYGYHMPHLSNVNTRVPTYLPDGTISYLKTSALINPNFSTITLETTDAHFNYNGLQAVLQKRLSFGLTFQATYAFSKTMSDADQINGSYNPGVQNNSQNAYNLKGDYSLSGYDQRHTLTLTGAYRMPWEKSLKGGVAKAAFGGWSLNSIYSYGSGLPLGVIDGFDNVPFTVGSIRPNLIPGFSNNPINGVTAGCAGIPAGQQLQTPTRWFDPCAFALSPSGTYGNLGRLTVTGPGTSDVDFAVIKDTQLKENLKLEFRGEIFNLFNHANFAVPGAAVFSSSGAHLGSAGVITATTIDNREIQLGLKLVF